MSQGVLIVDINRVLEESKVGRAAAEALEEKWKKGRKASGAAALKQSLEKERDALRDKVLARVRPALAALVEERGALVVLPAKAVVAHAAEIDVTDALIAAVDAQGPL